MELDIRSPSFIRLLHAIDDKFARMEHEIDQLTADRDHWRKEAFDTTANSIQHNDIMMGHLLNAVLAEDVVQVQH